MKNHKILSETIPQPLSIKNSTELPLDQDWLWKHGAMNAKQVAMFLGISIRALFVLTVSGDIPSYRIGRRRLYKSNLIIEWQEEQVRIEHRKIFRYKNKTNQLRKAS